MNLVTEAPVATDHPDDRGSAGGLGGLLWLTWRQHRWALLGTLALAVVLIGWMTYLSIDLAGIWRQCHHTRCPAGSPQDLRLAGSSKLVFSLGAAARLVEYAPLLIGLWEPAAKPDFSLIRDNAIVVRGGMINYDGNAASTLYDVSGHQLSGEELQRLCPPGNDYARVLSCYADHQLRQHLHYQPGSRIPEVHLIIAAGYLGLAAIAVVTVWWLVRRTNLGAG